MINSIVTATQSNININPTDNSYNRSESKRAYIKILIVDDEIDILDEMKECLDNEGFDCLKASNAVTALSIVRNNPDISVIITDIKMTGMDGLAMMRILHEEYHDCRDLAVIVSSAYMDVDMMIEALHVGANDFLIKPLSLDTLVSTVRKSIALLETNEVERKSHEKIELHHAQHTIKSQQLSKELLVVNNELESKNILLASANSVKSDFICLISHEMRTPLNAIIGLSTLAMDSENSSSEAKNEGIDFNREISKAGNKLLHIINSILDLVNIDTRELVLDKNFASIEDIVNNVVEILGPKAADNAVNVCVKVEDSPLILEVDINRLSVAFSNVIINAIEFSAKNSEVKILIKVQNGACLVSVKDEGIGMNVNEVKIALERFRQVDARYCRNKYGIGLGLTLAKMYIELHAGCLSIMSKPNVGTTVSMVIPMGLDERH